MPHARPLVLLGPQRFGPTVREALAPLLPARAPVAVVTAGWEEREAEDIELGQHVGAEVLNLELHQRSEDVLAGDREIFQALRARRGELREIERLYRLQLRHLGRAAEQLLERDAPAALIEPEREVAIRHLRSLDAHRLARVEAVNEAFRARWQPSGRPSVARHREELATLLQHVGALCIAGGDVGILFNRLWLFDLPDLLPPALPVVAWSAGAMVLAERIVLFHDRPPQGRGYAEVWGPGLGLAPGVVPLPHASRRLRLDNAARVQLLARRFPDALCAALDEGARLAWDGQRWSASPSTQELTAAGHVRPLEGAR